MIDNNYHELKERLTRVIKYLDLYAGKKDQDLLEECMEFEKRFFDIDETNSNELIEIKYQLLTFEKKSKERLESRLTRTFMVLIIVLMVYAAIYLIINDLSWAEYISLVVLGIVGSFLYLLVNLMSKSDFIGLRMTIAVIMPLVMISLIIDNGSGIAFTSNAKLLSFLFGFSSELLLTFLNKLAQKAKKIIE